MSQAIQYRIVPSNPRAHLFTVTCTVPDPAPDGQILRLPTWIPGSYLVREFARNVVELHAQSERQSVAVTKVAKDAWQCAPCQGPLSVTYDVYAWDLSVRAAHLDETHGFVNGPSVVLHADGKLDRRCEVDIVAPEGERYADWRVATSLARAGAPAYGFGRYAAADYDELIDHPMEVSAFTLV